MRMGARNIGFEGARRTRARRNWRCLSANVPVKPDMLVKTLGGQLKAALSSGGPEPPPPFAAPSPPHRPRPPTVSFEFTRNLDDGGAKCLLWEIFRRGVFIKLKDT